MIKTIASAGTEKRRYFAKAFIDGLPVSDETPAVLLAEMERAIAAGEQGHYISVTNTESMYHGLRKPDHGMFIRNSDFSLCDGVGIRVAGWSWGLHLRCYNGPVFQLDCSKHGEARGWRHFFCGGKEGVAEEMAKRLKKKFPELIVCGTYTPPFRELTPEEDAAVVAQINQSKPDIVWVGLGLLKQERWSAQHLDRVEASWMVGVGAAFDYHSGAVPWAPAPVRALGLAWLFSFIIQPRRRARRHWRAAVYVVQTFLKGVINLQFVGKPKLSRWPAAEERGNDTGEK